MSLNASLRWFALSRSKAARRRRRNAIEVAPQLVERLETRRLLAATAVPNETEAPNATAVPDELLIQFEPRANATMRANVRANVGAKLLERIDTPAMRFASAGVLERVKLGPGLNVEQAIARLKNNPNVRFAEPNFLLRHQAVSNDPYYTGSNGQNLWGMYSDDPQNQVGPAGTHNPFGSQAEQAWDADNTGSRQVYVGVIDQGTDYRHPDLYRNIAINQAEIPAAIRANLIDVDSDGIISFADLNDSRNQGAGKITDLNGNSRIDGGDLVVASGAGGWANGNDADGNGHADDLVGWDFLEGNNTTYDSSVDFHGTHVSGTIGGQGGNGAGVAGMSWDVSIIPVKFLGPLNGTIADAISSIDYLINLKRTQGYNIVAMNASWGGSGTSQAMLEAIGRAANEDILFVAAAGNGGPDQIGDNNDVVPSYPANADPTTLPVGNPNRSSYNNVISVAAISSSGSLAGFSNFGANTVHLGAPGVGIISTLPNGSYGALDGTSMAAPHVTGAVVLYAAAHPNASAETIRSAILNNVLPTPSLNNRTITDGRLNVNFSAAPTPPAVTINDVSINEGNSGTTNATFTVTLSKASTESITVQYATANGTAQSGSDYTAASSSVTFAPGQTSKTVTVPVRGDAVVEPNETFFVNLSLPAGTNAVLGDSQGRATIVNDDVPPPSVTINDVSINEGNSGTANATFTVTLSKPSTSSITVQYTTANGTAQSASDYTATNGSVTFAPGQTSKTITVPVRGDAVVEPNETFFVNLSLPAGTNAVLGDAQGRGTIVNDDASGTSNDIYVADMTWATGFNWWEGIWTDITIHIRRDADGDGVGGRSDPGDQGVAGASVTLLLIHDSNLNEIYGDSGDGRWGGTARTLGNGTVTFTLSNSPYLGGFRAEVTALTHSSNPAYTWNAGLDGENPDFWARGLGELSQNGAFTSAATRPPSRLPGRSPGRHVPLAASTQDATTSARNTAGTGEAVTEVLFGAAPSTLVAPPHIETDEDRPAGGLGPVEFEREDLLDAVPAGDRSANDDLFDALSTELADLTMTSL